MRVIKDVDPQEDLHGTFQVEHLDPLAYAATDFEIAHCQLYKADHVTTRGLG